MPTLSELLAIDPEHLTLEQQNEIVDQLRANRKIWTKGVSAARAAGKRPTGRMPKEGKKSFTLDDLNITLEDLI